MKPLSQLHCNSCSLGTKQIFPPFDIILYFFNKLECATMSWWQQPTEMLFCFCLCCFLCNVVGNWLEVLALGRLNSFLAQRSSIQNEERIRKCCILSFKAVWGFFFACCWKLWIWQKGKALKILIKNNNEYWFSHFYFSEPAKVKIKKYHIQVLYKIIDILNRQNERRNPCL